MYSELFIAIIYVFQKLNIKDCNSENDKATKKRSVKKTSAVEQRNPKAETKQPHAEK